MDAFTKKPTPKTDAIYDLRSAIERLKTVPGQFRTTSHPVDPHAELAGVYKRIGAGGTVMRPTRNGPAMLFENVTGFPGSRVLVGLMADRARVALLLDAKPEALARRMGDAVKNAI